MDITAKSNSVFVIKKSFDVSLYVLIFSLLIPVLFGILGSLLDRISNPFSTLTVPLLLSGLSVFSTGAGIIVISILYLCKNGRGLPASPVPPANLVIEGPYGFSRHPIYFGASLSFLGAGLLCRSFWCTCVCWPLFTLFFVFYATRIEEPVLEDRFGQKYRTYKKNVPLLWEFPFRKTLTSLLIQLLDFLSRSVNKPFILTYRTHRFFLGYGLWLGVGSFVGLTFVSLFLICGGTPEKTVLWMTVVFTLSSMTMSRLVSMATLLHLEKVTLKTAWFRVGFVSWGAMAAALLCGIPYIMQTHSSLYVWLDAIFTGLMITHFFGRLGCLFYGCCYGKETHSPIRIQYTHPILKALREKRVKHGSLYPTQLFSSLYSLFIFLLVTSIWGIKGIGVGVPTSLCLIFYGIFRFMEEWFRFQKKKIAGIFSPAQLICFGLVTAGIVQFRWIVHTSQFTVYEPLVHITSAHFFSGINLLLFAGLGLLTTIVFSYFRFEIGRWGKEAPSKIKRHIMDVFYKKATLHCQNRPLSELAEKFGTPLYVISKQAAQASVRNFLISFKEISVPVKLHYSVKTQPVPGFLQIIKEEGQSVEVISEHELILCRKLGFRWEDIVINGPAKSIPFLRKVKNSDVKMVVIESLSDLERLNTAVENAARPLNVGVRICPGFSLTKLKPTLNSGAKHSPYGFQVDSDELKAVLDQIKHNLLFRFVGFHVHLGSGIRSGRPYKKAFSVLEKAIKEAHEMGLKSQFIDIGGGFGLATAPILNVHQLMKSTLFKRQVEFSALNNGSVLNEVARHLEVMLSHLRSSGIRIKEILTEPGRIISGPSELLILSILDVIEQPEGYNYLICDGGAMSLSPLLFTEYHKIMPLNSGNGRSLNYTVLGNMPSTLDKLSSSVHLPRLRTGDRIALLDTGAYFVSMNNNFAGPRPAIVLIDGQKAQLTRRRESIEDMYQRDYF